MRKFQYQVLSRQSPQKVLTADPLEEVIYSVLVHCYFELLLGFSVLGRQIKSFFQIWLFNKCFCVHSILSSSCQLTESPADNISLYYAFMPDVPIILLPCYDMTVIYA